MTNEQIIWSRRVQLAENGTIGYTGRMLTYIDASGAETKVAEPEPLHTFQAWKEMGYAVKKGEHAVAAFPIWKHTVKEKEGADPEAKMFMKTSHFFTMKQVEKIERKVSESA